MKRMLLSLLVIGLCAGVGTPAIAQNVTAGDQPKAAAPKKAAPKVEAEKGKPGMNADSTSTPEVNSAGDKPGMSADEAKPTTSDAASAAVWKAKYNASRDKAQTVYNRAKAKCDTLDSSARTACMKNATAARTEALVLAKSQLDSHTNMDGRPRTPTKGDAGKGAGDTAAANTQ
jgi:hypothetical protein